MEKFNLDKFDCQTSEPSELKTIFVAKKAVYHKSCVSQYNSQKLQRATKASKRAKTLPLKPEDDECGPSKQTNRNDCGSKIGLGELKCLFCLQIDIPENFCAAGTMHAKSEKVDRHHVLRFTETLKTKALKVGQSHVLAKLSTGDVTANEIYYHKKCLKFFNNAYNSVLQREMRQNDYDPNVEFQKELHFRRVVNHVIEQKQMRRIFQ